MNATGRRAYSGFKHVHAAGDDEMGDRVILAPLVVNNHQRGRLWLALLLLPTGLIAQEAAAPTGTPIAVAASNALPTAGILAPAPNPDGHRQPLDQPRIKPALRAGAAIQAALDRRGFGVGLMDGRIGQKTRQALLDFRYANDRISDAEARQRLLDDPAPVFVSYTVTADDRAQVGDAPTDWEQAAQLPSMSCRSLLEWLSEKFHATQNFLGALNPDVLDWNAALTGTVIWVPNTRSPDRKLAVAQIAVDTHCFRLRGYDKYGRLTCSFPCSIARDRAKVPVGELQVANLAPDPNYTFDPENFPESARAQQIGRKLILPPGPRNPVGVCWVSLSQPGYGIHGTPHPETIGNMESHGCFRLCNWDARSIGRAVTLGLPVVLDGPPRVLAASSAPPR